MIPSIDWDRNDNLPEVGRFGKAQLFANSMLFELSGALFHFVYGLEAFDKITPSTRKRTLGDLQGHSPRPV